MSAARKPAGGADKPKKAKKKDDAPPPPQDDLDELDASALSAELELQSSRLASSRRSRNYAQLSRDQVQGLLDLVSEEVTATEAHLRNLHAQMERMAETQRNDIRIYLQKVVHLEYEHENNLAAVHAGAEADKDAAQRKHAANRQQMHELKLDLRATLSKTEVAREEEIRRLKEVERKELAKLREQFDRNYAELVSSYESRLSSLRDELELRCKLEVHEIEERKNRHINDLMIHHARNFDEMRAYYNSITQDNLHLIRELNAEIEDLKLAHHANERAMEQIEKKNASLSEPLAQAENRVAALRHKLANYDKDAQSLRHAKARLAVLEEQYKNMVETAARRRADNERLAAERARLYATFDATLASVSRASESHNDQLSSVLEEYAEVFELKKAQFTSVLRASNLDPVVLASVTRRLDDVLSAKNEQLDELQYERAKLIKAHNDLVRVYDAKLRQMGVPEEQLHLEPILHPDGQFQKQAISTAPADLIVQ